MAERVEAGQGCLDLVGSLDCGNVFPDPQDGPPFLGQVLVGVSVTALVGRQFRDPPLGVVGRPRPVLRTAVPEATVDEHSQPRSREGDVDRSSVAARNPRDHSIAATSAVELLAKCEFGRGVPASSPGHAFGQLGADGARVRGDVESSLVVAHTAARSTWATRIPPASTRSKQEYCIGLILPERRPQLRIDCPRASK